MMLILKVFVEVQHKVDMMCLDAFTIEESVCAVLE